MLEALPFDAPCRRQIPVSIQPLYVPVALIHIGIVPLLELEVTHRHVREGAAEVSKLHVELTVWNK